MRKITQQASEAFKNHKNFKQGDTQVEYLKQPDMESVSMYLHGNEIARLENRKKLILSHCGWKTQTTKERLNGVLEVFNSGYIKQIQGVWYINKIIDFNYKTGEYTEEQRLFDEIDFIEIK